MNCPKCNAPLLPNAQFCGSCGLQMAQQSQPQQSPPNYAQPNYAQQQPRAGGAFHFDADNRGQGRGYTWAIEYQGAFALAVVNLQPEQAISAEAGAMVSMSANID